MTRETGLRRAGNYAPVRLNAVKHGLLSNEVVLPGEDPAEFAGLRQAFLDEYRPAGATESVLVDELACTVWRKRRLLRVERAFAVRHGGGADSVIEGGGSLAQVVQALAASGGAESVTPPERLDSLGRYEARLDRKFERTLAMLVKLKELRVMGGAQR